MDYCVVITKSAQKDIDKLPREVQRRIVEHFPLLEANPRSHGAVKLEGSDL